MMNKLDLSLLVVTKGLSQAPENYAVNAPHVELAKKMAVRDPVDGARSRRPRRVRHDQGTQKREIL